MKRFRKNDSRRQVRHHHRRGAVFHYYMMYLFLSSILLTTAGLSLHLVLKADRLDEQVAHQLRTLLRLERDLRRDVTEHLEFSCKTDELIIRSTAESTVYWSVDANRISRVSKNGEKLISSNRFVFRKGTKPAFVSEEDDAFVRLTILESPIVTSGEATASTAIPGQSVEILLSMNPPEQPELKSPLSEAADSDSTSEQKDDQTSPASGEGGAT